MKIIRAKYLLNEHFDILKNQAIAFDKKIVAIGEFDKLTKTYKNAKITHLKDTLIAPAFVNTHVHLEFSANKNTLVYGDFITWLGSVIQHSAALSQKCTAKVMQNAINSMLKSGIASVGAISSFGKDIEILAKSPLKVVLFNEILGSNESFIEQNFKFFLDRFNKSFKFKNECFIPAVSLHSPYSLHPNLAKKAINFAKTNKLLISTHFLESYHEKEWLENGTGEFKNHLKNFTPNPKPMYKIDDFFGLFNGLNTLFTHCVYVDDFSKFDKFKSITHCPTSNRLLGKRALNLQEILKEKINFNIGTDGLSSNLSLNFFDELRTAVFTHQNIELNTLCKALFRGATLGGAKALGLNNGVIKVGKDADIMAITAPKCGIDELLTQIILHTKKVKKLYIGGEVAVS